MASPPTADLARALAEFVSAHRGLRLSRSRARPTAYAGPGMFAYVDLDGLVCRLPREAIRRELARGARPVSTRRGSTRGGTSAGWILYPPRRGGIDPDLARVLEESVRYVALLTFNRTTPDAASRRSGPVRPLDRVQR